MKLKEKFTILTNFFEREKIDYALIGAFALHAYGYTRATKDIDFITHSSHQTKIIRFLDAIGFKTLHQSDGFSNHMHPIDKTRFDLVYVDDSTAKTILNAASPKTIIDELTVKTVSAKHLVILKLFSVKNDPSRKLKEFADIKELLDRKIISEQTLRESLASQNMESYYEEIAEADK